MQNDQTPTEGNHSENQKTEAALDGATCSTVWYSIADWGDYDVFNGRRDNITHDKHDTQEQAEGVCRMLRREGFGGNRQVFPVRAWASQTLPEPPNTHLEEISLSNAEVSHGDRERQPDTHSTPNQP